MRPVIAATALALLLAGAAGSASAAPFDATATLSSKAAGARDAITIRFRSVLQCSQLQVRTVQLRLPQALHVPARIPRADVLVGSQAPASIRVEGSIVTLRLPRQRMMCMTITFDTVTVRILRAAGLRNPRRKGSYDFTVVLGARALLGSLKIA